MRSMVEGARLDSVPAAAPFRRLTAPPSPAVAGEGPDCAIPCPCLPPPSPLQSAANCHNLASGNPWGAKGGGGHGP